MFTSVILRRGRGEKSNHSCLVLGSACLDKFRGHAANRVAFILHPDVWLSANTHGLAVLESAPEDFCFTQI